MDTPSQVWYFILQYLNNLHNQNMNLNECLNFLFQLSFSELGKVIANQSKIINSAIFVSLPSSLGLQYGGSEQHSPHVPSASQGIWTGLPKKGRVVFLTHFVSCRGNCLNSLCCSALPAGFTPPA